MTARKILFWIHLSAGVAAGVVILILSLTGMLLSFERQIKSWSDRAYAIAASTDRAPIGRIVSAACTSRGAVPTMVRVSADPTDPVELAFENNYRVLVNPHNGVVVWEGQDRLYRVFSGVEQWHRWLGASNGSKSWQRELTGAANLAFLLLLASGPFLWWRNLASWERLKKALWFRKTHSSRGRNLNWHDVAGAWCVVPLFVVSLTGVLMSYAWATDLLYRMTGANAGTERAVGGPGRLGQPRKAQDDGAGVDWNTLDALFQRAEGQVANWRTITLRLPSSRGSANFVIETGGGGRPDQRFQLVLDPRTGDVQRWEAFSNYSLGRRLRAWARFVHTGEAAGLGGQAVGFMACTGGALLVWSGLSLAIHRFVRWRKRVGPVETISTEEETASLQ